MDTNLFDDDPHLPYVAELTEKGDWAGLVRYFLAFGSKPPRAIEGALEILGGKAAAEPRWEAVREFVNSFVANPFNPENLRVDPVPSGLSEPEILSEPEKITLGIVPFILPMTLCEAGRMGPMGIQQMLFQQGLKAAQFVEAAALFLEDQALGAFAAFQRARAYQGMRDLEAAGKAYGETLWNYRKLAARQPGIFLQYVAGTLNNLGNVLCDLNELEAAREAFDEALKTFRKLAEMDPEVFLQDVAGILNNLGTVLNDLNELEAAREAFDEALEIRRKLAKARPEVFIQYVAETLNNLGRVLCDLNDLQAARQANEEALQIRRLLAEVSPEVFQKDVAMTLSNLGRVLRGLNDLEAARETYAESLKTYRKLAEVSPEVFLQHVAWTLNNLGGVLSDLNDLEAAREAFGEALENYRKLAEARPEVFQKDVAAALNGLGGMLCALNYLEAGRETLGEALENYRNLAETRPDVFLQYVAASLNNLGNVLSDLNQLEAAREAFGEALETCRKLAEARPEVFLQHVAGTLNNLGIVLYSLNDLEAAREAYDEAAAIYTEEAVRCPFANIPERQKCWANLGHLLRTESVELGWPDYRGARDAFREARDALELFRSRFADPEERKRVQGEALDVYRGLVQTCIDLFDVESDAGALEEAVEAAEASRARGLIDLLVDEELQPRNLPEGSDLQERFGELRRRLRQVRAELLREEKGGGGEMGESAGPGTRSLAMAGRRLVRVGEPALPSDVGVPEREALEQARREAEARLEALHRDVDALQEEEQRILREIQVHDPEYNPDQPVLTASYPQIRALIPDDVPSAAIQFFLTGEEGFALIVTTRGVERVRLPGFGSGKAFELANRWWQAYYTAREQESFDRWSEKIPGLLEEVSQLVLQPVVDCLWQMGELVERLILCPHQALHIFPLHACRVVTGQPLLGPAPEQPRRGLKALFGKKRDAPPDGKPLQGGEAFLGELYEICYTPSLSMLRRCARRQRAEREPVLVIGDPTGDLFFTKPEAASIQARYGQVEARIRDEATREAIFQSAPRAAQFLYTGHSVFNPGQPLKSALVLGSKHDAQLWLTLGEMFTHLELTRCSQVVLNGCESGMLLPDEADEYVNLPTGFLFAGAQWVVSTLWVVHDLSAALLMDKYHELWNRDNHPASALREAQRWLREDIRDGRALLEEALPPLVQPIRDDDWYWSINARIKGKDVKRKCREEAEKIAADHPDTPPFASPVHWAPFTVSGIGFPA